MASTTADTDPSAYSAPSAPGRGTTGRGNWRGRGRGRGGGRGGNRGGAPAQYGGPDAQNDAHGGPSAPVHQQREPKPPLTHFLSMPLGHHPELRDRVSAFTRALLASAPAVPGLDASIVIAPRRLHLTLGVMSLASPAPAPPPAATTSDASQDAAAPQRTLDAALALLHALAPRVRTLLGGAPLRVALERVDVMRPDGGDPARAHVLWAGPAPGGEGTRVLRRVAEFVSGEFRKAGLVVDERRPLKLHCTVLNTVYRRPRPTSGRAPFSYTALLSTPAFEAIKMRTQEVAEVEREQRQRKTTPVEVNLGEYTVDEIQICEMGSWGPEGEYVSVGSIAL